MYTTPRRSDCNSLLWKARTSVLLEVLVTTGCLYSLMLNQGGGLLGFNHFECVDLRRSLTDRTHMHHHRRLISRLIVVISSSAGPCPILTRVSAH
jgi:hypothetical protein